ncbi:MAG: chromosome segregation protein [Thermoleophilaceae bacterium]|jgi:chromosome segregation protein|nr:chromosome segregation protein [Thermoleophilaceae bacterium]
MHLRSISMKGFKSFPDRTKLEFGTGVSVIVGPNGSGKSNITDGVLWALGEQSPLAVRGQVMKDVIFAGGHGVKGSSAAEVEVVIDNADGQLPTDFSEISIVRRLNRDGEGEYRLNGARCRLVDVMEVLSDSGLGKEMHSVVSQGKVEQIVLSRPRERRLLIEEAAGLGKHRKRRRRAQLKLERTTDNLGRALDVEREARSRLRPLKRQAEAAELHERLERQTLEARYTLARDASREARAALTAAEERARAARAARDEAERLMGEVARRREQAEQAFAAQNSERERIQGGLFAARSAAERITMRLERVREQAEAAAERRERRLRQLELLEAEAERDDAADAAPLPEERLPRPPEGEDSPGGTERADWEALPAADRIRSLEREIARLETDRQARLRDEIESLETELQKALEESARLEQAAAERQTALATVEQEVELARSARREAERGVEAARARAAQAGAELATVNQFLRTATTAPDGSTTLAQSIDVEPGYELALAAALGPRLAAALVDDVPAGERVLDRTGDKGGTALVGGRASGRGAHGAPPPPGAEALIDRVRPESAVAALAERLLAGVWVVDSLDKLPEGFAALAVTRGGRWLDGATGELSQAAAGGPERVLEERRRRDELIATSELAVAEEADARRIAEAAAEAVARADAARDEADAALRRAAREAAEAAEGASRTEWVIARRREAPDEGPGAVRRAELLADLRAERRMAERVDAEREERGRQLERARTGIERDATIVTDAERAAVALDHAQVAVAARRDALAEELDRHAAGGEQAAGALRACAQEEAELQGRLKEGSEAVTGAEVAAQQVRDTAAEVERDLAGLASSLGLEAQPADEALPAEEREALAARVERLARRREQLGPVNPLAKQEYDEAVAHVEELEEQRGDLESALAELEGLITETDKRIRESFEETFEAAAKNFEEVVQHLFPGGRGRLRLVQSEGPRAVIAGEDASDAGEGDSGADPDDQQPEAGVEIEVTPPGKSTKRLSLLSGGEKSLVALAFMFAVFLARPCPFYILDEVEAALDDINIDRFLQLVGRYSDRAQFIVVTHQKRTMDAADTLYGVSMGGDGVSRVVSRRLGDGGVDEVAA